MVGDSTNDIEAGVAAGSFVVTVPYGYNFGEEIDSEKVDLAIDKFHDLQSILG